MLCRNTLLVSPVPDMLVTYRRSLHVYNVVYWSSPRGQNEVVAMQKTTCTSATTYGYLRDPIRDQHSWSMYPPLHKARSPRFELSYQCSILSVLQKVVRRCSSMFGLQCSVFGPQVFLCRSAVCGHKCVHELEADSIRCEAGGMISNSAWVVQFHPPVPFLSGLIFRNLSPPVPQTRIPVNF